MKKILIVGITPPPYGGQAMMTERLVKAQLKDVRVYHVRMAFSQSMSSVGNFEIKKVFHMLEVVARATYARFKHNTSTLYYMPGGSSVTPIVRDVFILFFLRPLFSTTIFHFRAAGVSEIVARQPWLFKKLMRYVYRNPDIAIQLSALNPEDGHYFGAKKTIIVPNGLEDAAQPYSPIRREAKDEVTILYVGVIQASKGVKVLVEAARILRTQGYRFRVNLVGDFASQAFKDELSTYCQENDLEDIVHFLGVKMGAEKWKCFLEADIFCFPSFFEAESFGNVAVEAMMFELPVVATQWRGIPDIVKDGETGLLVPIRDAARTAEALQTFILDDTLRKRMGEAGRECYEEQFGISSFMGRMEQALGRVE